MQMQQKHKTSEMLLRFPGSLAGAECTQENHASRATGASFAAVHGFNDELLDALAFRDHDRSPQRGTGGPGGLSKEHAALPGRS